MPNCCLPPRIFSLYFQILTFMLEWQLEGAGKFFPVAAAQNAIEGNLGMRGSP
jgi:hypothetical protein